MKPSDQARETQALLEVLALRAREDETGKVQPVRTAFADICRRIQSLARNAGEGGTREAGG